MATIQPSVQNLSAVYGNQAVIYTWVLAVGDDGAPVAGPGWADRSFQVTGTFGGASVTIEGSNDGSTYLTLNDPFGSPLNFPSPALRAVTEVSWVIRPRAVGGDGTTALAVSAIFVQHGLV
jgi:hypothetical protein